MLRALILCALAPLLVAGAASATPSGGTPGAFVTLEGSSQVVGVDLTTGRVIARIRVPKGPRDVTSYGARYLLVVSPPAHAVTLVDSFEKRVLEVWRGFGRPVAVATDGAYAYVADAGRSELAIIDLATWKVTGRMAIRPEPRDVALGDVALLTHARASANLTVAELSRDRRRVRRFRRFAAGGPAAEIVKQADTAYAYLTYSDSGTVGGVAWGTERLRWQRRAGLDMAAIYVDHYHGRRLWVADRGAGAVLALATEDGRVLRRLRGCNGARDVSVVGTAWVAAACNEADALAFWSQRTWKRSLVRIGREPHGIAEVVLP